MILKIWIYVNDSYAVLVGKKKLESCAIILIV
jgi:hypothetical protein